MASPARFNFDLDFDSPPSPPVAVVKQAAPKEPEVPSVDLVTHLLQLNETDQRARAEGFEQGRASAEAQAAQRLADEAARLTHACRALLDRADADRLAVEREAVDLAVAVARKLAGKLVEREPLAEIRALIADSLAPLRKAPHLVLRIAVEDADAIRPHVDKLVRENGFEGRMVILGEDDMPRGDCRVEWADGGIVRDSARVSADIDAAVARYMDARERAVSAR
jgi:flagellar assembly protein FliH